MVFFLGKGVWYFFVFFSALLYANTLVAQEIYIAPEDLDYSIIEQYSAGEKYITLYNKSNIPCIIENISTSCNCTLVEYNIESIAPQDSAKILIKYNTKKKGKFRRSIIIKSNAINANKFGENIFYITGEVINK